jgi:carboxyl-terminal processing protease
VTGALQDHDRAWILGTRTFGKGLVQTVYPLSENTGVALTTAHFYTPSSRLIQRDYTNKSFYDYYFHKGDDTKNPLDVKMTEGGPAAVGLRPTRSTKRPRWTAWNWNSAAPTSSA